MLSREFQVGKVGGARDLVLQGSGLERSLNGCLPLFRTGLLFCKDIQIFLSVGLGVAGPSRPVREVWGSAYDG